ncbi:MAG: dephospho-CoA kinase [Geobacter sp.]|nr:dephospho-CoA kinase [Geobacter sp.]
MRIIGLTGGIASGKSTVARILKEKGAQVIDADQLARDVVVPGTDAHAAIVREFGSDILCPDGTIDRGNLGAIVFADSAARRRLEAITHPAIAKLAEERLDSLRKQGAAVVFYMAPLLIEAGITGRVDDIWVVYVDRETQLARLMARDGSNRQDALRKIESQMPMEEKRGYGREVIDNRGSLEETTRQVFEAWERLGS